MKHTLKALTLALIALTASCVSTQELNADDCQEERLSLCFLEGIEIWGDFLYWRPCVNGMTYAAHITSATANVNESYEQEIHHDTLRWDWTPGFRAGLAVHDVWGDWRLAGSYTYLSGKEEVLAIAREGEIVLSPWQFSPLTNPSSDPQTSAGGFQQIKGKIHLSYHSWELLLSRLIETRGCYTIASFVGVEGLFIKQKVFLDSNVTPSNSNSKPSRADLKLGASTVDWRSDFEACGIKFGADCIFPLGRCLQLFSRGAFTIALGEDHSRNRQLLKHVGNNPATQGIHPHDEKEGQWVNGYQIQMGLIYTSELCGYDFGARLGYEFVKWHNIPTPSKIPSGNQELTYDRAQFVASDSTTLGFHGLIVGLSLTF